jgi:hypothetical protein
MKLTLGAFAFEPKTSFPEVLLEPLVLCSVCCCFGTGVEACSTDCFDGLPSKRLPKPLNGISPGTFVAGSFSTEMQTKIVKIL